jgi:hypothetical protein
MPRNTRVGQIFNRKKDVIRIDGSEQVKDTDYIATGKVLVRTCWSEDFQTLITKTELPTLNGPGTFNLKS